MSQFDYEHEDQSAALNTLIREMNQGDRRDRRRRRTLLTVVLVLLTLAVLAAILLAAFIPVEVPE